MIKRNHSIFSVMTIEKNDSQFCPENAEGYITERTFAQRFLLYKIERVENYAKEMANG